MKEEFKSHMVHKKIIDMNVKDYYKAHPEASLKDYIEAEEEENERNFKELEELEENRQKWYQDLVGRYFEIKFNSEVTGFVYINKSIMEQNRSHNSGYIFYEKCRSRNQLSVSKVINRYINPLWFDNPYDVFRRNENLTREISREEYDEITKEIEEFLNKMR